MSASLLGFSTGSRAAFTICCTDAPCRKSRWMSHNMLAASSVEPSPAYKTKSTVLIFIFEVWSCWASAQYVQNLGMHMDWRIRTNISLADSESFHKRCGGSPDIFRMTNLCKEPLAFGFYTEPRATNGTSQCRLRSMCWAFCEVWVLEQETYLCRGVEGFCQLDSKR